MPWQWILTIALTDLDFLLRSAQICKKMHYFPQLKDHNSGRKKDIRQMTPFFSCTFWALMTCDIHFCIWKLLKFIFMGSLLWSIQVYKIPEFSRWKLPDQNFVPFDSGNIHIKQGKKPNLFDLMVYTMIFFFKSVLQKLNPQVQKKTLIKILMPM